ncbi:uncharacterized protein WM294_003884 [Sarcoramphus papa]
MENFLCPSKLRCYGLDVQLSLKSSYFSVKHWLQEQDYSVAKLMLPCNVLLPVLLDSLGDTKKVKLTTGVSSDSFCVPNRKSTLCCTLTQTKLKSFSSGEEKAFGAVVRGI